MPQEFEAGTSVLQSSTSIISASSGHMIPPQESGLSTTRKRVCSPPPQVALHSPHADQSETSQSSAQHMVLQSWISVAFGHLAASLFNHFERVP